MMVVSGKLACNCCPNASISVEITNETINKNPRVATIENDKIRFLIRRSQPFFLGFAFTPQMLLIESWISPNTVVAPMRSVKPPMIAAQLLLPASDALRMISWSWLRLFREKTTASHIFFPAQLLLPEKYRLTKPVIQAGVPARIPYNKQANRLALGSCIPQISSRLPLPFSRGQVHLFSSS